MLLVIALFQGMSDGVEGLTALIFLAVPFSQKTADEGKYTLLVCVPTRGGMAS
jgi:hypothetical protein